MKQYSRILGILIYAYRFKYVARSHRSERTVLLNPQFSRLQDNGYIIARLRPRVCPILKGHFLFLPLFIILPKILNIRPGARVSCKLDHGTHYLNAILGIYCFPVSVLPAAILQLLGTDNDPEEFYWSYRMFPYIWISFLRNRYLSTSNKISNKYFTNSIK